MRKGLFAALLLGAACAHAQQPAARQELFPYPVPPDGMTLLRERCNFLVYNFWSRADMKKVFDQPEKLNAAFGDWISFMPYCAADTAHLAINNLLRTVAKDGKKLQQVARMAENWTFCDTTEIYSEELYRPFAAAAATSKKVPAADRARFSQHLRRINSSALGQTLPSLPYVATDGTKHMLEADSTLSTMIVVADPSDMEATTAGIRFSIDPNTRSLIEEGRLRVAWFVAGAPSPEAEQHLAKLPDTWVKGSLPDVDDFFSLRVRPAVFLLDEHNRVILKDRPYQMAMQVFHVMAHPQ
ncbi:MAG: DUF5106 domain-containing protein [Muribaculaceae bacterium]|nr:DUF5106 domain-containing protein [Muribaculaceae bacterium]